MGNRESILVVDDDLDFLKVIRHILEARGYRVATASSASEAISLARKRFYHVAVLDISLPDTDGTELLSALLDIHPDITAIMLTGYSSLQNAMQSLNRGAFAYLEKPLDPEHLLSVINRGLEKQRLVVENRRLIGDMEQHNREISVLLAVSQAVSQSLDLGQIIDSALARVIDATPAGAAWVQLVEDGRLVLTGHRGLTGEMAAALNVTAVNEGVLGQISRQGIPLTLSRAAMYSQPTLVPLAEDGYQSCVGILLTIAGEHIGVLGVAARTYPSFSKTELNLLAAIGRELSIAVQNARLYEEASSARALRELDAMRTEFLATVSHELRSPLAVIKGSASSLLQPDVRFDEKTWREFLESIDKDADTLSRLVEELLMMSRLEAGALEIKREWCQPAAMVEPVRDRLKKLAPKHKLGIDIPRDLPRINVDGGRIGEVLTNLVENAVKYSGEGSPITVTASGNGSEVTFSVADRGRGIPEELHQKVFNRFFQVDSDKDGRGRGTGLGLAICRGIIDAHGGRMWVESKPGSGAIFKFSLPTGGGEER